MNTVAVTSYATLVEHIVASPCAIINKRLHPDRPIQSENVPVIMSETCTGPFPEGGIQQQILRHFPSKCLAYSEATPGEPWRPNRFDGGNKRESGTSTTAGTKDGAFLDDGRRFIVSDKQDRLL